MRWHGDVTFRKVLLDMLCYVCVWSNKAKKQPRVRSGADEAKRKSNFGLLEEVLSLSRTLPTIQLFDAIWQMTFAGCVPTCKDLFAGNFFATVRSIGLAEANAVHPNPLGCRLHVVCQILVWHYRHLPRQLFRFTNWQRRIQAQTRAKPMEVLSAVCHAGLISR